ncbi:hypothetical protein [Defluviimonas sp. WL0075]|uniref:Cyclic di-GMP-binding protein n=1 Tax=Albidovulum sediminicola TaxID=2984331 RepID=A0ABT2Z4M1_9RHOB|nr:hypothetical protein [Defluviimonas sp. WL0075]MCV2866061.1 hypothetical protein [Defluviimonas sp. WL0075]
MLAQIEALGNVVVMDYSPGEQSVNLSRIDPSGRQIDSGQLRLNLFANPPEVMFFYARRGGDIDLVVEASTRDVRETALLRLSPTGELRDIAYTSTGAVMHGAGMVQHGAGVIVVGEIGRPDRGDSAAALTYLVPGQAPQVVVQDTPLSNDRFLAVSRVSPDRILVLGAAQSGATQATAQTGLYLSLFDGQFNAVRNVTLPFSTRQAMDRIFAVPLRAAGFLLLLPDDDRGPFAYRLIHMDDGGSVLFEQPVDFAMPTRPRGIIDLRDGRFLVDAEIVTAADPVTPQGRLLALMKAGPRAPILALSDLSAAIVPASKDPSRVADLIVPTADSIFLQGLDANQFEFDPGFEHAGLPVAGVADIRVLDSPDEGFTLSQSRQGACMLELTRQGQSAPTVLARLSDRLTAIGFSDNTLALVGPEIAASGQRLLPRLDLVLPQTLNSRRLAAQIRNLAARCAGP